MTIRGKRPATRNGAPFAEAEGSADDMAPEFSLSHVRPGFSPKDCERDERAALMTTLQDISSRTWGEIKKLHRHKGGFEQLPQLRDRLPPAWRDSMPIAFRFLGMAPVIGVRVRQTFHILWVDAKMRLYRH